MKFKKGDIVKCKGTFFAVREILEVNESKGVYVTKFLEDNSVVETSIKVLDANYFYKLKEDNE